MKLNLSEEERLYMYLKGLFESFGYTRFMMRRFEEYSLYAENLNFLQSKDIITFGDRSGRLLALKPDVTLSIVRNCKGMKDRLRKLYYRESVYRPYSPGGQFREIGQIGLELVGDVDAYCQLEALALAAESLKAVGGKGVMEISHMGALGGIAQSCGMDALPEAVMDCVRSRNLHDMKSACLSSGISEEVAEGLRSVIGAGGSNTQKIDTLRKSFGGSPQCMAAADELERVLSELEKCGKGGFEVDFSLVNDPDYYNGVIFQGYTERSPRAVLSGGRYDNLVNKFGAGKSGIGFALYPDELAYYSGSQSDYDADVLLLYEEGQDGAAVYAEVEKLVKQGLSVRAATEPPAGMKFCRTVKI